MYKIALALCLCLTIPFASVQRAEALEARDLLYAGVAFATLRSQIQHLESPAGQAHYANESATKAGISDNPKALEVVSAVTARIVPASERLGDRVETPFLIRVTAARGFDAYRAPGNFIAVSEGLVKSLAYNEDELAFVVAHEVGHGTGHHLAKSTDKIIGLQVALSLYSMRNNQNYLGQILAPALVNNIRAKGLTLPNEWDADARSFRYATEAGYNPGAGAAAFVRARAVTGEYTPNGLGGFFNPNDHPTWGQRIARFNEQLYDYSGKRVYVKDQKTVMIDGQAFITITTKAYGQLPEERAYLIAGKLSRAFHSHNSFSPAQVDDESRVMLGDDDIIQPAPGEPSAEEIAARLNSILRL